MAQQALKQEDIPKGGIADFIMADEDFAYLEAANAEKEFGNAGIAKFDNVARRMASYGRYGDDLVAHVETGEIVVPKRLIEKSPELKESIFQHLRDQGVTDPERYVVGSSDNSINPETGLREFGFFSNIFNGIKKVLKTVAGVALPILGSMVFGPIYGAALGQGVATLIQGGNIGDALKSGLTAGALGGAFSYGKGFLSSGNAGGLASLKEASKFSNLGAGFDKIGNFFSGKTNVSSNLATDVNTTPKVFDTDQRTFGESFKGAFDSTDGTTFGQDMKQAFLPEKITTNAVLKSKGIDPFTATAEQVSAAERMAKISNPGIMRKALPLAAAGTTALALAGGFNTPEQEDIDSETGQDLIDANPEKYLVQNLDVVPSEGPYEVPTIYTEGLADINPLNSDVNPYRRRKSVFEEDYVTTAADGGEIFPRRTGGIMPSEGVPNEDSVRAMVMPGEFIMTTDAVKGAGGGNLKKGIQNMYSVMRNLENRAGGMA
tara:strand:+ start:766 stop:2235 length:1470 start_codon:yes stop_codon:yes gene_type:complete